MEEKKDIYLYYRIWFNFPKTKNKIAKENRHVVF